jgi:hypothetical protein
MAGISEINRALIQIPKRAEQSQAEQLRRTFVDSGVAATLEAIDHQVLYGRRGTGKTHALRYLEGQTRSKGDIAVYLDLRTLGSPDGLFPQDESQSPTERTAKLLVDLLSEFHNTLLEAAIEDEELIANAAFVNATDQLADAISTVRVDGDVAVEIAHEESHHKGRSSEGHLEISHKPSLSVGGTSTDGGEAVERETERREGRERLALNFNEISRALRLISSTLSSKRVWLLLDEWSSVPLTVQPFLGEFLVRCVLPLQRFSVKIAAIEQQSRFQTKTLDGVIGLELGADVAANVDLDEFMVFEQDEDRAREFFIGLFFKHLTTAEGDGVVVEMKSERELVRQGFTEKRAFDELVRAAEGVPRDAINIAAKAALKASSNKIAVPSIRDAARSWYQSDKAGALKGRTDVGDLLNWIIDEVIRGKRARGFLVNQREAADDLLLTLFDARVLHIVRRGYSAQDEPGERFDVWVIDYGAYVDLLHTKYEPQGLLPTEDDGVFLEVPPQDLRAIRRAILSLDRFKEESRSPNRNQEPLPLSDH